MIEEAYVSYEVSKLLKEKGFNEYCPKSYSKCFYHKLEDRSISNWGRLNQYPAPTQQMAMRWLRERYNIHIDINFYKTNKDDIEPKRSRKFPYYTFGFWDASNGNNIDNRLINDFIGETYEEACEAALLYSLENLVATKENNE